MLLVTKFVSALSTRSNIPSQASATDRNYTPAFDREVKVCNTRVSHSKELLCSDTRLSHAQVSDSPRVAYARLSSAHGLSAAQLSSASV